MPNSCTLLNYGEKLSVTVLFTFIIMLCSCNKDCIDSKCDLPDLQGTIDAPNTSTLAGNSFEMDQLNENLRAVASAFGPCTKDACKSNTVVTVEYINSNSTDTVATEITNVPEIKAGKGFRESFIFKFQRAGTYLIVTETDGTKKVEERREDNNIDQLDAEGKRLGRRSPYGIIVKVLQDSFLNLPNDQVVSVTRTKIEPI